MGKLFKVINLAIHLAVFGIIALLLHEAGHSLAAHFMGISGYIKLDWTTGGGQFIWFGNIAPWQDIILSAAGGAFVVLIVGILLIIGQHWGQPTITVLRVILTTQIGYGLGEITTATPYYAMGTLVMNTGVFVGFLIALIWALPGLARWFGEE